MNRPSYLSLFESGVLARRADEAMALLPSCTVCPRNCRVDRTTGERGYCHGGLLPEVASYGPHFGEEPPLVGRQGSGTIFLSGCNMRCVFCQNYAISRHMQADGVSCEDLAGMMLSLQERHCNNINFVTPSHFVPQILRATGIAAENGLSIPLVYNTGTYDTVETLRLLDGVFDIYMPDAKYGDEEVARALSDAPGYVAVMQAAIAEMQRQVGDLVIENGIAVRGLIIRHLVLPGDLAGTDSVLRFIGEQVSEDAYVNIMDQYRYNRSTECRDCIARNAGFGPLVRGITEDEFARAIASARKYGLHRGFPGSVPEI
ncbi:MAG: radical SAM protein [Methanoregulaceae archaeon]|nr:radical SAM protein [Methanoregulaceae archaeon]